MPYDVVVLLCALLRLWQMIVLLLLESFSGGTTLRVSDIHQLVLTWDYTVGYLNDMIVRKQMLLGSSQGCLVARRVIMQALQHHGLSLPMGWN